MEKLPQNTSCSLTYVNWVMPLCVPRHGCMDPLHERVGVPIKVSSSWTPITKRQSLFVVHSLTLLFEGEVLREMPALMVASEQEECGWVVDLQRPQEQHTLQRETQVRQRVCNHFGPFPSHQSALLTAIGRG